MPISFSDFGRFWHLPADFFGTERCCLTRSFRAQELGAVRVCRGHDVLREMMLMWVCQGLSQWGAPPIWHF